MEAKCNYGNQGTDGGWRPVIKKSVPASERPISKRVLTGSDGSRLASLDGNQSIASSRWRGAFSFRKSLRSRRSQSKTRAEPMHRASPTHCMPPVFRLRIQVEFNGIAWSRWGSAPCNQRIASGFGAAGIKAVVDRFFTVVGRPIPRLWRAWRPLPSAAAFPPALRGV